MTRTCDRSTVRLGAVLPSILLGALALSAAEPPAATPPAAPANASPVSSPFERDAELARRLDALLAEADPGTEWSISVEAVSKKDQRMHRILLWSDGVGIWDDESQFRLEAGARKEILKAFRDQGFCQVNDELFKEGSGKRQKPNGMIQEQAIRLEIGGVSKTVTHVVSTFGRYKDVEEAAQPLVRIENLVRTTCEGPAAKGIRAKDLADGLSKVAGRKLADVTLKVFVNRPKDADGDGWMTRLEGRRVSTQVSPKGKGWVSPVGLRLSNEEFVAFVRTLSATKPGRFPQNLYDEGYTDLTISVLNRSVTVQARPFANMDPKAHADLREAYRAAVAAIRKLHEEALAAAKKP